MAVRCHKCMAVGAGVVAGYLFYRLHGGGLSSQCAAQFPGASQSFLEAAANALDHPAEDAGLGASSLFDWYVHWESLGLVDTHTASAFYAWWNGLTDAQRQQLSAVEPAVIKCAADELRRQSEAVSAGVLWGVLAGAAVYALDPELEGSHAN